MNMSGTGIKGKKKKAPNLQPQEQQQRNGNGKARFYNREDSEKRKNCLGSFRSSWIGVVWALTSQVTNRMDSADDLPFQCSILPGIVQKR